MQYKFYKQLNDSCCNLTVFFFDVLEFICNDYVSGVVGLDMNCFKELLNKKFEGILR